jgi:prepilin peptidase CpaA
MAMLADALPLALLLGLGAAAATFDVIARRVPNALAATLAAAGVIVAVAHGAMGAAIGGGAVGLALMLPLFAARWVGGGDAKLAAALGVWLGPAPALWMIVLGLALGGVWAAVAVVRAGTGAQVVGRLRAAAITRTAPVASAMTVPLAVPLLIATAILRVGAL